MLISRGTSEESKSAPPSSKEESASSDGASGGPGTGMAEAYYGTGMKFLKQGKLKQAVADLKEALFRDPKSDKIHDALGMAILEQGNLEEAREHFAKAVELNPDDAAAKKHLAAVMEKIKAVNQT